MICVLVCLNPYSLLFYEKERPWYFFCGTRRNKSHMGFKRKGGYNDHFQSELFFLEVRNLDTNRNPSWPKCQLCHSYLINVDIVLLNLWEYLILGLSLISLVCNQARQCSISRLRYFNWVHLTVGQLLLTKGQLVLTLVIKINETNEKSIMYILILA